MSRAENNYGFCSGGASRQSLFETCPVAQIALPLRTSFEKGF
jgi:hypothetical protein